VTLFGGAAICGAAHAGTLFDAYQSFCVKPVAQSQAVLAVADALHFDKLPAASLEGYRNDGFSAVEGRGDAKSHIVIIVGKTREVIANHPREVAYCTVMAALTEEKALVRAEFDRWMSGIKPSGGVYSFVDDGERRRPFETIPPSQVISALESGKVRSAAIHDDGGVTKIVYVADAK
jgi:hypothetical protein